MKTQQSHERIYRMVLMAILMALVVVLQIISSYVKFGPFSITLTLIPIVIGACLLGVGYGAVLGLLFGVVVTIFVVANVDVGGYVLFSVNPYLTVLICLVKGTAAGAAAGLVYKAVKPLNEFAAVVLAAVTAPIVNTGLFIAGMLLFFMPTLKEWAGGTDVAVYIFTGLTGVNFLVEFLVSAVLSPAVATVLKAVRK